MRITNENIIQFAEKLQVNFSDKSKYIPMKIGFAIQKNLNTLIDLAREIEESKMEIGREFGILQADGGYQIPPENMDKVSQELNDLSKFEQDVPIKTVLYSDIESIEFTMPQVNAIMFMIEDDSEE